LEPNAFFCGIQVAFASEQQKTLISMVFLVKIKKISLALWQISQIKTLEKPSLR
jgi:hypothetical protein